MVTAITGAEILKALATYTYLPVELFARNNCGRRLID